MVRRGCKLRNTEWAIGVVVFTGVETGIMMNGSQPFTKTSNLEQRVNNLILILFAIEIAVSMVSAGFSFYSCQNHSSFVVFLTRQNKNCP
jgi:phospholipid-translocating ATPase